MVLQYSPDLTAAGQPDGIDGTFEFSVYSLRQRPDGPPEQRDDPAAFGGLFGSPAWEAALRNLTSHGITDAWVIVQGRQGRGDFTVSVKVRTPAGDISRAPRLVPLEGE
jgi:hypothetical protein